MSDNFFDDHSDDYPVDSSKTIPYRYRSFRESRFEFILQILLDSGALKFQEIKAKEPDETEEEYALKIKQSVENNISELIVIRRLIQSK